MIGIRTAKEHYYGASGEYDESWGCAKCGEEIEVGDGGHLEKRDDMLCAECISRLADGGEWEEVFGFIGYDNIFDVLHKMGVLNYR